jgi:hypothetical protein
MNPTAKTIAFLRTLTLDGYLTSDEVWAMAKFFNDNPECQHVWPGQILVPMLHSAFDDGSIAEDEMVALAETISSIEQEWMDKLETPDLPDEEVVLPTPPRPAQMPVIDLKIEVPSQRESTSYVVALRDHSCTCPEGPSRGQNPARHPSRCCKHMAYAFMRSGKVFEPWFQALLDDCYAYARGTPSNCNWMLVDLQPKRSVLLAGGNGQWCTVYAPGDEGYESFAFHAEQKRWSYGESPAHARLIEHAIRESFAFPQS